jgi:hypothetical protein
MEINKVVVKQLKVKRSLPSPLPRNSFAPIKLPIDEIW